MKRKLYYIDESAKSQLEKEIKKYCKKIANGNMETEKKSYRAVKWFAYQYFAVYQQYKVRFLINFEDPRLNVALNMLKQVGVELEYEGQLELIGLAIMAQTISAEFEYRLLK